MKVRIITGAVAGFSAIAILLFFPVIAIRILAALILLLAMHELLAVEQSKHVGVNLVSYAFAASCPFLDMMDGFTLVLPALFVYMLLLAFFLILSHEKVRFEQCAYILAYAVMIIFPIAFLSYTRAIPDHGKAFLFYPMIIAWFSDMGAYFTGSFLGKHKLCEKISPKKTVEGFFGGIVVAVLFSLLGAFIYQCVYLNAQNLQISYWLVALIAFLTAPISVLGDLFCSVIKRHRGIKDFGNIFPGHGGILDRFDSLIFVSPIIYFLCQTLPIIQ